MRQDDNLLTWIPRNILLQLQSLSSISTAPGFSAHVPPFRLKLCQFGLQSNLLAARFTPSRTPTWLELIPQNSRRKPKARKPGAAKPCWTTIPPQCPQALDSKPALVKLEAF